MKDRESIYAALFARVSAAAGFVTVSRRLQVWGDVPMGLHPALFQIQKKEIPLNTPGMNQVWTLTVDIVIYAHTQGDKSIPPSSIINGLVDAVIASISPEPVSNKQTLGGLCEHVWVDGSIVTDEGILGDQAVVVIPITIKVS
jgi:hypothetical protein